MKFVKKLKRIIPVVLLILLCVSFSTLGASAFDSNDYGGGGGGWDSGSSWDSDSDWGGGGGGGGDIGPGEFVGVLVIFAFFIFIAWIASRVKKKREAKAGVARPSSYQGLGIQLPDRTAEIEYYIKVHDPNFSASDFISFVKRMYIDIQLAWCKRDMTPVRALLHDNLYDATTRQVNEKIEQGVVYHYESMVVNTAYLTSYAKDAQFEYLTVYLNARMIDWQEDEKTGKILRGDKTTRWDLRYKMKFMRTAGVQTKEENGIPTGVNCPNCGAPLDMASSAKCTYCGAVVTTGQYSWVLSDFGTVRNDTVDEGIRIQ